MKAQANAVKVQESLLRPIAGSTIEGDSNPAEIVHLTVRVRPRSPRQQLVNTVRDLASKLPAHRRYLTREEHAALHGADRADLDKIKKFASRHGLAVTDSSVARGTVHLVGNVEAVEQAFGVDLKTYVHGKTRYRAHDEHATVPPEFAPIVEAIFGFDTRPYARPHFRISEASRDDQASPLAAKAFTPDQLAKIYNFPPDADGTGQVIGIIELSAPDGSGFRTSDLDTYFKGLGLETPDIVTVSVDGARTSPVPTRVIPRTPMARSRWTSRSRGPSRQGQDRGLLRPQHASRFLQRHQPCRARQRSQPYYPGKKVSHPCTY